MTKMNSEMVKNILADETFEDTTENMSVKEESKMIKNVNVNNTKLTTKVFKLLETSPEFKSQLIKDFPDLNDVKVGKTDSKMVARKLSEPTKEERLYIYKRLFNVDVMKNINNVSLVNELSYKQKSNILFATKSDTISLSMGEFKFNKVGGAIIFNMRKPGTINFNNGFSINFDNIPFKEAYFFNGKVFPLGSYKIVYFGSKGKQSWKNDDEELKYYEIIMEKLYKGDEIQPSAVNTCNVFAM